MELILKLLAFFVALASLCASYLDHPDIFLRRFAQFISSKTQSCYQMRYLQLSAIIAFTDSLTIISA